MAACCSISRQALIFSLRQTQQRGSLPIIAVVSALHTEHLAAFFRRSGEMDCFACSRISTGTTGSDLACNLRFISTQSAFTMTESGLPYNQVQAASGTCTTTATSREEPHRWHFCPLATRGILPLRSISAGTV